VITVSRDFHKRARKPLTPACAYLEGVAAAHEQKDRAFKVIQKYTRLKDQKLIEVRYNDSVKFLERVPCLESEAIAPIVEFMGKKKPIAVETIADNAVVDRLVREGFVGKLTEALSAGTDAVGTNFSDN